MFGVVGPLGALPPGTSTYNTSGDTTVQCTGAAAGRSITMHAPTKLWPPNHKYYTDISVTANGLTGDMISLTTEGDHNQYTSGVEDNGAGNTANDIAVHDPDNPSVSGNGDSSSPLTTTESNSSAQQDGDASHVVTSWEARAERSGTDSTARVYTLTAMATFDGMRCTSGTTDATATFSVPHDMRPSNR